MGSEFCPLSLGWISPLQSSHTSTSLRSDVVRRPLAGGRVRNSLRYSVVYYFGSIFFSCPFSGHFSTLDWLPRQRLGQLGRQQVLLRLIHLGFPCSIVLSYWPLGFQ